MESASTAGNSASEELQKVTTPASLNTATPGVQKTNDRFQPVQHGGYQEKAQTPDGSEHRQVLDSPSAENGGEQAEKEENDPLPTDDFKDDASIASIDLRMRRGDQPYDFRTGHQDSVTEQFKRDGAKYARAASIYTETLEQRVMKVERELLELQYEVGSKEKPGEESDRGIDLNSPCSIRLPLKVMEMSLKDWKDRRHVGKWDKASIFLATSTGTSSAPFEPYDPGTYNQGLTLQSDDKAVKYDSSSHAANVRRPGSPDIARLAFRSPWPLILIELLSGDVIWERSTWIRPFKHIVVYEKQIRKCLELLNETDVDGIKPKDLPRNLNRIISEVVRNFGPKREDVDYSDTYVSSILQKRDVLKNHHVKAKKSSSADQEEELEDDTKAEHGLSSNSPVDDPLDKATERSRMSPEGNLVQEEIAYVCTCLKDARDHLQLLVNTMDSHLGSLLLLHKAIRDRVISKISFEHLWHLFQPGDLVVTSRQPRQAYRVIHVSGGRLPLTNKIFASSDKDNEARPTLPQHSQMSPFNIDCVRFDFDGEKFGPVQNTISIPEYEEERIITKLDVYPIGLAEKEEKLSNVLLDRGRRFAGYHDFQHKRYEGLSLNEPQEEIESEVIIDFTQAFRQPGYAEQRPQIGLQGVTRTDPRELYEDICPANQFQCLESVHNSLLDDTEFDKRQMDRFLNVESHGKFLESRGVSQILTEAQLILLPYHVHGFSLRSRKWVPLNIDLLQDIKENESLDGQNSGFDDLVIPNEYKRIVKALVKSHALGSQPKGMDRQQIDLIRGKGKGLIILLHGVPGVGKTSTAESVASYTGRPLFPITCGDIGQTAYDVEHNLEAIFLLARKWGCVLLLDEADVFLAKREKGGDNIDRNALVSVFLRTLEYYSGILFLTTNRIGSFDEAFKSRIHISLYYAPLSESQTFEVWAMNLNRLSKSKRDIYVDRHEIEDFARSHWKEGKRWNGRQIRNAFQTAVALAEYEFQEKCEKCEQTGDKPPFKPALDRQHFEAVAKTSAEFDDYLQSVMGGHTYEQKAQMTEMRSDAYNPDQRGIETPSGKKFSHHRAVRPRHSGEQPAVRESEALTKQTATPPVTPQPLGTGSMGSSAALDEEEEYRQYIAEQERQKEAEKMERFRKRREMEQMGK